MVLLIASKITFCNSIFYHVQIDGVESYLDTARIHLIYLGGIGRYFALTSNTDILRREMSTSSPNIENAGFSP